jgi:DNA-nicking Smr family endonuclease
MTKKPTKPPRSTPDEDELLFQEAMQDVRRLPQDRRSNQPLPKWSFKQQPKDHHFESESVSFQHNAYSPQVSGDETLSYRKDHLREKTYKLLKQGRLPIEARLDLHGHTADEAIASTQRFLDDITAYGVKCCLIVHGKGQYNPNSPPLLKNILNQWLRDHQDVIAFHSARPGDGGTGALYILLKSRKR